MSAFAGAMAVLLADPNIDGDAQYRRATGDWAALRVVRSAPYDQLPGLGGGASSRAGSLSVTIAADALASLGMLPPQRGDEVLLSSSAYRVEDAEADVLGVTWRLTLATAPAP
ncbi:MAG: hypothetical protein BGP12_09685 [Rhodospirillales bacterium 70-18]|nr:hypothetical protein [Rhodospirillales bacterium]OJY71847.1 MAG: hypothetical protein BGP12_09685 [Rhodospirillales bacterium 70-18]